MELSKPLIDGRIIFTQKPPHNQGPTEMQIKYQSLNPAPQFRTVVDAARSVILAGGTMSPVRLRYCPPSEGLHLIANRCRI